MSNVIQAKNAALMVKYGSTDYLIGCEVDFNYHYENEMILKTSVNDNGYRSRRVRISDVSSSCSGVATTTNDVERVSIFYLQQDAIRRSVQYLKFVWEDNDGIIKVIAGNFLIGTIDVNNPMGDFSKFEISFRGAGGGISIDPVLPPPEEGENANVVSDTWTTTPGATSIDGSVPGSEFGRTFDGKEVIAVFREGLEYDLVESTPGNRQARFTDPDIEFMNAFNEEERVFVIWIDD